MGNLPSGLNQYISSNMVSENHGSMFLKNEIDPEKLTAMREFLHYFIKKRNELIKKIEKLSLIEKGLDKYQT